MKISMISAWFILAAGLFSNSMVNAENTGADFLDQTNAVSLEELDSERGKGGVDPFILSKSTAIAVLEGNSATNTISGINSIDGGSFNGASGMFSIIQNSGNNVIIQDSTVYNVTVMP
ncbi:hypothetical protein NP590_06535 [Methylomonas sp. SURF-2]|uniref:Uncharacterized protein n=1 Tax=Methylomonas subterranea TaxID=2952225 RepID=A0ABT1TET0_9GAMM|nr:hypothetical protein [Methylomonas sp. SURF-2]MCQ8103756.1 hypothetical protein [Methylomonas sp. SURF-2]